MTAQETEERPLGLWAEDPASRPEQNRCSVNFGKHEWKFAAPQGAKQITGDSEIPAAQSLDPGGLRCLSPGTPPLQALPFPASLSPLPDPIPTDSRGEEGRRVWPSHCPLAGLGPGRPRLRTP